MELRNSWLLGKRNFENNSLQTLREIGLYTMSQTQSDGVATFRRLCEDEDNPPDFCEALAYSKDTMVVMPGWFVDDEEMQKDKNSSHLYNPIGRWYKEWFFKHVEGFLSSKGDEKSIRV